MSRADYLKHHLKTTLVKMFPSDVIVQFLEFDKFTKMYLFAVVFMFVRQNFLIGEFLDLVAAKNLAAKIAKAYNDWESLQHLYAVMSIGAAAIPVLSDAWSRKVRSGNRLTQNEINLKMKADVAHPGWIFWKELPTHIHPIAQNFLLFCLVILAPFDNFFLLKND